MGVAFNYLTATFLGLLNESLVLILYHSMIHVDNLLKGGGGVKCRIKANSQERLNH